MEIKTNEKNQTVICEKPKKNFGMIQNSIKQLSGKWTLTVLWLLWEKPLRFGELKKLLPDITQHMLTSTLRDLEKSDLVRRDVFAEVPPRVEYSLSEKGVRLQPVFEAIISWSASADPLADDP